MKRTHVPSGETNAAVQRLLVALGESAHDVITHLNAEPDFAEKTAQYMIKRGYEPSASQRAACDIMGRNFFGIEEAIRYFGIKPTQEQLQHLEQIPFSEEVLRSCKDTHILVAAFRLSILDIRSITKKRSSRTLFYPQSWCDKQAFAKDKGEVSWQLVRKESIANSTSKTWNDQQALLSETEETPTARIVVYTMIGHFFATGERLFEKIYVHCIDLDSDGNHVSVGVFDSDGLNVDHYWNDYRHDILGLSAAWKK